jgi:hypothetical protein
MRYRQTPTLFYLRHDHRSIYKIICFIFAAYLGVFYRSHTITLPCLYVVSTGLCGVSRCFLPNRKDFSRVTTSVGVCGPQKWHFLEPHTT